MSDITTLMMAASGAVGGEYEIERSLRFNSADSAYLNRTPASASNRKTWTWSGWVKRAKLSHNGNIFSSDDGGGAKTNIEITEVAEQLNVSKWNGSSYDFRVVPTQVFRDPSAWQHLIIAIDTTQATASNRVKIYINGSLVTALSIANYPTQNSDLGINNTTVHSIGDVSSAGYYDGYMTEINFIDGQALTPSDFGEFNTDTGVWSPIKYTGTYGTNGFYLNFSDNTSTTTLGDDLSGNGNDWTTNNFSVTAGAGNDSLVDSPTRYGTDTGAGGEVRGNYATWNPLDNSISTLNNGNLSQSSNFADGQFCRATMELTTGKWYWEGTITASNGDGSGTLIGICNSVPLMSAGNFVAVGDNAIQYVGGSGNKNVYGSTTAYGATYTTNDVIGVAVDKSAGTIEFFKNNVSQGVITDARITSDTVFPLTGNNSTSGSKDWSFNFGQRPFAYTAPSGFKALVTTNLPDPTIVEGDEYFNTVLYTGTGSSQSITGVGFQPDWVWYKERSSTSGHLLFDVLRGVNNLIVTNNTDAEQSNAQTLTSFNSDGFSVGNNSASNESGETYVAWNWKANGAGVSNTDGTISSTVSVSTTSGFSIVTYTGTGSAATVGHGLSAVPRMIIVKNRDAADAWQVYHAANTANPETDYLVLNTTAATADAADRWNDTLPTSTVFSIGNGVEVNTNTEDYVAYCFAPVAGYSAFGSYTGNGSADGPFVFTGFRPAYVILKRTDNIGAWWIFDAKRNTYNVINNYLFANAGDAEASDATLDFLSNGFKLRIATFQPNTSGATFIYACFATSPFKLSLAR